MRYWRFEDSAANCAALVTTPIVYAAVATALSVYPPALANALSVIDDATAIVLAYAGEADVGVDPSVV
jgi:hypothetical protein